MPPTVGTTSFADYVQIVYPNYLSSRWNVKNIVAIANTKYSVVSPTGNLRNLHLASSDPDMLQLWYALDHAILTKNDALDHCVLHFPHHFFLGTPNFANRFTTRASAGVFLFTRELLINYAGPTNPSLNKLITRIQGGGRLLWSEVRFAFQLMGYALETVKITFPNSINPIDYQNVVMSLKNNLILSQNFQAATVCPNITFPVGINYPNFVNIMQQQHWSPQDLIASIEITFPSTINATTIQTYLANFLSTTFPSISTNIHVI